MRSNVDSNHWLLHFCVLTSLSFSCFVAQSEVRAGTETGGAEEGEKGAMTTGRTASSCARPRSAAGTRGSSSRAACPRSRAARTCPSSTGTAPAAPSRTWPRCSCCARGRSGSRRLSVSQVTSLLTPQVDTLGRKRLKTKGAKLTLGMALLVGRGGHCGLDGGERVTGADIASTSFMADRLTRDRRQSH